MKPIESQKQNILIFGAGYVGTSLAVLFAQYHNVALIDLDKKKIKQLKNSISPIKDKLIQEYLSSKKLNLRLSTSYKEFFKESDIIILAVPTNFMEEINSFDTSIIEDLIESFSKLIVTDSEKKTVIIKSTVPIGLTTKLNKIYKNLNIFFIPEFLREGKALHDNLYPSRIVIGSDASECAQEYGNLFKSIALNNPKIFKMSASEAESVKLFANTYLATRVSFFNEIDTFCMEENLNPKNIIDGISSDTRIGNFYNNPSFGYGGYCLPKDTRQLLSNLDQIPNELIKATIESNKKRKEYIAKKIIEKNPKVVGIYRLVMKSGSDNFRDSAIIDIIKILELNSIHIIVFEPLLNDLQDFNICNNLEEFKSCSELIITNRNDKVLNDVKEKIFSRDIYNDN